MAPNLPKPETPSGNGSTESQEMVWRFAYEIRSINVCLEDIRHFWGSALGITGPQLMILMALSDLDRDKGVPGSAIAKLLKVDPSFITIQSKLLEKKGFLRRKSSANDARVMQLSLAVKARKHLANIAAQQEELDQFLFGDLVLQELTRSAGGLTALRHRLERARLRLELEFLGLRRADPRKWRGDLRILTR
ncbi:MarR family transcriptional regulator [Bradyrhizobium sp. UFLA05-153]